MKAQWGSIDTSPHILDLGTRWRWVVSSTPHLPYPQGNCDKKKKKNHYEKGQASANGISLQRNQHYITTLVNLEKQNYKLPF